MSAGGALPRLAAGADAPRQPAGLLFPCFLTGFLLRLQGFGFGAWVIGGGREVRLHCGLRRHLLGLGVSRQRQGHKDYDEQGFRGLHGRSSIGYRRFA